MLGVSQEIWIIVSAIIMGFILIGEITTRLVSRFDETTEYQKHITNKVRARGLIYIIASDTLVGILMVGAILLSILAMTNKITRSFIKRIIKKHIEG